MKRLALVAVLLFTMLGAACTRISPGHVGVVVENAGDDKGVLARPVVTGWQFYTPGKTNIYEFPTYNQTAKWTRDTGEGHPTNEELQFITKDGQTVTADMSMTYSLNPQKIPNFFVQFRIPGDALDTFTHGFLRNVARQALADHAINYSVEELYFGTKKVALETDTKIGIEQSTGQYGVTVIQLGFLNNLRPPENYVKSIQEKLKALQDAQQVTAQQQIAIAEAGRKKAEAEGEANANIARARGEAEAMKLRQSGVSAANLDLQRIQNETKLIDKWDGKLPDTVMGGNVPFMQTIQGIGSKK